MYLIQSDSEKKLPHHFDCSCALYGAYESAQKYRLTSYEEVESGKLNLLLRKNVVVGSVEFMIQVFTQLGIEVPELPLNANRQHENITLADALKRAEVGERLFIKPTQKQKKLFTGFVLDRSTYTCLRHIPNDTEVMAYKL